MIPSPDANAVAAIRALGGKHGRAGSARSLRTRGAGDGRLPRHRQGDRPGARRSRRRRRRQLSRARAGRAGRRRCRSGPWAAGPSSARADVSSGGAVGDHAESGRERARTHRRARQQCRRCAAPRPRRPHRGRFRPHHRRQSQVGVPVHARRCCRACARAAGAASSTSRRARRAAPASSACTTTPPRPAWRGSPAATRRAW